MYEELIKVAMDGAEKYAGAELSVLKDLASIDCGTGNIEGNKKVVARLKKILEEMDVVVEERFFEGAGTHLIVRATPSDPKGKIVFAAHMDTVFDSGDVEKHPVHIDGDWAYGLGIADCKGGIITSIYALKIMLEAGMLPKDKEFVMIYTCDEEIGSPTGKKVYEEAAKGADMAFVCEPAREENGVLTERKGICVYKLSVKGKTAHPTLAYHEGRSAVVEMAYQTVALYEKNRDDLDILYNVSDLEGGSESGGVPEYANASVCTPVGTKDALEVIEKDIEAFEKHVFIDGCENHAEAEAIFPYMPPTEENRRVYRLVKKAGELLGQELPEQSSQGASDANVLTGLGVPSVCGIGPYMKDIHTFNERLYIPSIKEKTALTAVLMGILGEEE